MNLKFYSGLLIACMLAGCSQNQDHSDEEHTETKFQYSAYSDDFEIFAEADPFITGVESNILAHFSKLADFKPLESGIITLSLDVNGTEISQTLEKPARTGIYSFDLTPGTQGKGKLTCLIKTDDKEYRIDISDIMVYSNEEEAHGSSENSTIPGTNTITFTKEQSWKIDFATGHPAVEPFGQVIKTTAQIVPAQGDEILLPATFEGIVAFTGKSILEGEPVTEGQLLFKISGSGPADQNISVQYSEAENNYIKARTDYERSEALAAEKIISEKELLDAKNHFENTRIIFENFKNHYSSTGQEIRSPLTGFIKQCIIRNGQHVEAGQPLLILSQNRKLYIHAELQQKYAGSLLHTVSGNIRTLYNDQIYTLEQLNGKMLPVGQHTNPDNFLIPVSFQIDNTVHLIPGGFAELYIRTLSDESALTVPNSALIEEQGVFFVMVQVTPELFEKREVKIGVTDGLKTEILSGINESERIVTKGTINVKLAQVSGTLDAHAGHVH